MSGQAQGVTSEGVFIFRGIPYVLPPLGQLRWSAPAPTTPWVELLIADTYGPSCWQPTGAGNDVFLENYSEVLGYQRFHNGY